MPKWQIEILLLWKVDKPKHNEYYVQIMNMQSKYFNFNDNLKSKHVSSSHYTGWNGLLIIKLNITKDGIIDNDYIETNFPEIFNKEKVVVLISGKLLVDFKNKQKTLEEYDSINYFSDQLKYSLTCLEDAELFIISAKKIENSTSNDLLFFNFKKDIKVVDLWGGKIISRPYEGKKLNIVLFEIKKGFQFEDKGHLNEQVTWLINGSMNFYVRDIKKQLLSYEGVDIGSYDLHGGFSDGAIGFDVFYPKREEKKYKNNILNKVHRSIETHGYVKTFYRILKYPFV